MALRGSIAQVESSTNVNTVSLSQAISGISNAAAAVVTLSSTADVNPFGVGSQLTFGSVAGMTQINGLTGTVTATGGTSGAWTVTTNINSSAFSTYTSGGTASIAVQSGDIILALWSVQTGSAPTATGFSAVSGLTNSAITDNQASAITAGALYKVAGGSEPGSYAFTFGTTGGNALHNAINLRVYSGRSASPFAVTPIQTPVSAEETPPVTVTVNGLTANAGDDLILFVPLGQATGTNGPAAYTPPSGWANGICIDDETNAFGPMLCACDYASGPGGSSGTAGGTFAYTGGGYTTEYAAYVISLANGLDAIAAAPSDTSSASGTFATAMTLAQWDAGTAQTPQLQRRVFFDDGSVKYMAAGQSCLLHEIYPITLGTGTLTIVDQNGTVIFSATAAQLPQGAAIPVDVIGTGVLKVSSFPTGGEYGMSWKQSA